MRHKFRLGRELLEGRQKDQAYRQAHLRQPRCAITHCGHGGQCELVWRLPSRVMSALWGGRCSAMVAVAPEWVGAFMARAEFGPEAVGEVGQRLLMRSGMRNRSTPCCTTSPTQCMPSELVLTNMDLSRAVTADMSPVVRSALNWTQR